MLLKKFDEEASKRELLSVIREISTLDSSYPELGTPSAVREMLANGNFNVEGQPWDFLVALGYSIISLCGEEVDGTGKDIDRLQRRIGKVLKYPMKWMYDAITPDVQLRYFKVAGKNLPQVVLTNRRIPRSLKGKCEIFAWYEYTQLQYVIRRIRSIPYVINLPTSDDMLWGIIPVRELRDLVASMENPPRRILEELNQTAIAVELEALHKDLGHAQTRAKNLASLKYAAEAAELEVLEKIAGILGADAKTDK